MTGFGGWVMDDEGHPTLDSPGTIEALKFIRDLRDKYRVIPGEADYNIADIAVQGREERDDHQRRLVMGRLPKAGIDIGVAPLPKIRRDRTLVRSDGGAARGFRSTSTSTNEKIALVVELLQFLMRPDMQLETARALWTMPTRREVVESEFVRTDDVVRNSALQIGRGRPMPMVPELRAIWDAMRPSYQGVLGGVHDARSRRRKSMQDLAVRKIRR